MNGSCWIRGGPAGADAATRLVDERGKTLISKNCALFTDSFSKINNSTVDNAKDLDVVAPMYNLIKKSDNFSETSESL